MVGRSEHVLKTIPSVSCGVGINQGRIWLETLIRASMASSSDWRFPQAQGDPRIVVLHQAV